MSKKITDYAFLFLISGAVILLDQWTKYLVRSNLDFGEIWPPDHWIILYARVVHWQNTGAAFGMLQNLGPVFTVLAFVVSIFIIYYFPKVPAQDWVLRLALSLQLGGAIGNLIDRLNQGYVTDFISLDSFAVFNVADASISIGTAILAITLLQRERKESAAHKPPTQGTEIPSKNLTEDVKGE